MPSQSNKAHKVSSLGESPAEARRRMQSSGGAAAAEEKPPLGEEVDGPLSPQHMAAIRAEDEGFSGGPVSGGTVEDGPELSEPPTPSKAMELIRQLSGEKLQAVTERDAALDLVERYRATYGDLN